MTVPITVCFEIDTRKAFLKNVDGDSWKPEKSLGILYLKFGRHPAMDVCIVF